MNDRISPGAGINSFMQRDQLFGGSGMMTLTEFSGSEYNGKKDNDDKTSLEQNILPSRDMLNRINENREERIQQGEKDLELLKYDGEQTLSDLWNGFKTLDGGGKESYIARNNRNSSKIFSTLSTTANGIKHRLTGSDKKQKNSVEAFFTDNWNATAHGVIIVIVIVLLAIAALFIYGFCSGKNKHVDRINNVEVDEMLI